MSHKDKNDYKIKLSPYHKIFYNEWILAPNSSKYNITFDQTLSSSLDLAKLKSSLHRFISDHLIINSHVKQIDGELYWVRNNKIVELEYFDYSNNQELIFNYISKPFELDANALYRFAIFAEYGGKYRFIIVMHHLIIDGNSFDSLINQISNYYNSSTYKTNYSLIMQENALKNCSQSFHAQLEQFGAQYQSFWDDKLNKVEPLDLRWAKSESDSNKIKEYNFNFATDEIVVKLAHSVKQLDVTTYIYSKCIFAILLHKYTSQNEIAISYPIAIKDNIPLVSGAQINTNIIIYSFTSKTTLIDLLNQTKQFLELSKNSKINVSHYPINYIINNSNKNLLDVMFAQTNLKNEPFDFNEVSVLKVNSDFNIDVPIKVIFEVEKQKRTISFRVRYNISNIDEVIITNFINQYKNMFLKILNDLDCGVTNKPISAYSILSEHEYNQIIYKWNKSNVLYNNQNIQSLFEKQVIRTPNNIAIYYEGKSFTYYELNERANQLAHYLRTKCGIIENDLIALYLDRSEYMLISIIGVLKAGGAYLPIDVTNPEKRITYILDDAKAKLLVTNMCRYSHISLINNNRLMNIENNALPLKNEHSYYINKCEQLLDENMPIIVIDDYDLQSQLKDYAIENPQLKITGNSLVYVMYTSGTTGKPKGVMLEQLGVTARIMAMIKKTGINPSSKYLFKTNYVFDVSFSDIFMTLLSGASLYITKSVFNIDEIYNLIVENDIDICHFVPSQLDVLQDYPFKEYIFNQLQIINVSGEKFSKSLMFKNTNIKYINYYGPTEAGEVSYDITDLQNHISEHLKLETIGYPLDHAKLYILDSSLKPLPIGAIGEIYIGGAALARGYLNQPILTSKRFIANPFQTEEEKRYNSNSRIYKTGDLARYLPNGNIEYIGRVDNQVKIRGYRVELEEIESRLSHYPTIKHTIALIQSDFISVDKNEQYIVAYYVSESKLDEHLIYNYLAQELPDYMLPDLFVHLEYLPLTTNGKLDKSKLPKIHINDNIENYVKPRNEVEQKICEIYADILKLDADKISANANFFKLGGNSISAIRLTFKLQNYFIVDVNDIFEYKTPANLAKFLLPNHTHLTDRLEQIKLMYSKLKLNKEAKYTSIKQKHAIYKRKMESFTFDKKTRPISTILLTGGTGYLGCHLLYQILSTTNHTIYLPIRADSKEHSYKRLYNKFKYYFDKDLNIYSDRINVFQANLNKVNLGLDKSEYEKLASNINSIIHCAALVKHYGSNSEFYLENVQATINLLELAKLSANKDFHYISTIGVFADKSISGYSYNIFTEDSIEMKYANLDNIYTKTKYQGEQVTLKYREFGIKTNIYRIGNLAINSVTKKTQENVEDNAFLHRIKTILNLGMVPQELDTVEISPVDCTATAIILLFNQESLYNQIYHVFNPKKYSLFKLLNNKSNNIRQVSLATFIDTIVAQTNTLNIYKIELFILHQWGLKSNISNVSETVIFQDKTNYILDQLQFKWANITRRALSKYS